MRVEVASDYESLSIAAARIVISAVRSDPDLVLALPTGETPLGMYDALVRAHDAGEVDFSRVRLFDLDAYMGLPDLSPHTNRQQLRKRLVSRVNVNEANWFSLDCACSDCDKVALDCENRLRSLGGLGLAIGGLGRNGHLAYNEPGSSFASRTRVVRIAEETRAANARFFESIDDVPASGITLGIATILESRRIMILASGAEKSRIVARVVEGPVSEDVPMTATRLHPDSLLLVDRNAAQDLRSTAT